MKLQHSVLVLMAQWNGQLEYLLDLQYLLTQTQYALWFNSRIPIVKVLDLHVFQGILTSLHKFNRIIIYRLGPDSNYSSDRNSNNVPNLAAMRTVNPAILSKFAGFFLLRTNTNRIPAFRRNCCCSSRFSPE